MSKDLKICRNCGHEVKGKRVTRGSFLIELVLWTMILPGLLYTIWRKTSQYEACPSCGEKGTLIPLNSPMAKKIKAELGE